MTYLKVKTFDQFVDNQIKLIEILNHNITEISTDLKWIKKFIGWFMGILGSLIVVGLISQ